MNIHRKNTEKSQVVNVPEQQLQDDQYSDPEQRPPVFKTALQEVLCCMIASFAPAASSMSSSAYQSSLSKISEHFDEYGGSLTWSVSSVMLANGGCLLLMGGIADAFGRKNALFIGFFFFTIFTLIGGFMTKSYIALCIFRAMQGATVACATPASAGFLGSTYKDSKRKNLVMSCFAIGAPVGGASGFFIAGVCLTALNWRSVHFFLSMVYGTLAIGVYIYVPNDKPKLDWTHIKSTFKKLDYLGSLLSIAGFTLICFSLTQVDATDKKWKTPYIIVLLIIGILILVSFVIYEIYIPLNPLIPMKMFRNKNFCLAMGVSSLSWMTFFGILNYYAVLYFEKIRGYSAIITACCFLTQPISGTLVSTFAGFTMHIIKGKYLMSIGCCGFLTSCIIWSTLSIHRNYFLGPFWSFMFTVLGADLIYNVANRCALSSVEKNLQSRAAGTFNTIIQLSSTVGLGLSSTILTSKYPLYGTVDEYNDLPALFHAIKYNYYFGIALSGTALLLSFFVDIGTVGVKHEH
ncbi:hypothetical protein CANARDRAFT_199702 [[Candida] arabinofermentans NRRL YB-2248]|uniref:Major facilitator superfamily (MFS) profile domain-containing protein n=1 Tax=[Candida] arabinofermentans NRRL YB-2248 TaxID=983967 RepID=A0A1E4SZD2_9ASCO|nr:hypothetical protein CANARDRAFT_199702 [[Candida] arabinofermentans NRRL YB-2248]